MKSNWKVRRGTNMKISALKSLILAGIAAGSLIWTPASSAQIYYTTGHGDIGIGYEDGELEPHWHLDAGEYAPDEVIARVSSATLSPVSSASFLGVADGSTIRVAGSAANQPNLGFGAEELDPSDWLGPITVTLNAFDGAGNFSLYTTNLSGAVTDVLFSSFNPSATYANNSFTMLPGDHEHFTFAFTEAGYHEITLTWSGTHVSDGFKSSTATYGFEVVPEPGTWALLGVGLVVVMIVARRRRLAH